jgi:hypothetical protein
MVSAFPAIAGQLRHTQFGELMSAKDFRDLLTWQKSVDLIVEVYKLRRRSRPKSALASLTSFAALLCP